ncbi:MAG: rod shape-determining protein, partial [Alcaligenaceae bacterium]|nr:rod shape-determining protein [Alcaligenaceae bacterium]
PRTVTVTSSEVVEALAEPLQSIVEAVHALLEKTPPELASDISEQGIVMVGGGALLNGMDRLIQEHTKIPVHVMEDAVSCVALGTGRVLEALDLYGAVALKSYARGEAFEG